MKKYLLFAFLILGILSMVSFQSGWGAGSGPGTTAPGESGATCMQGGCHASGNFEPSLDVFLIDSDGNHTDKYLPGESYTVSLKINHTGIPAGYGFQMVCLTMNDDAAINNFSDLPTDVGEVTLLGRQYVEQTRRLPVDSISMNWTAPAAETGTVIFYAAGNAVNGNGSPSGDGATIGNFLFQEDVPSSTKDIFSNSLGLYPNPANQLITIPSSLQVSGYQVYDLSGRSVLNGAENVVDISTVDRGTYIIQVTDTNGELYAERFVKI